MASNIPVSAESLADSVDTEADCCKDGEDEILQEVKDNYFLDVNCKEILDVKNSVEKYLRKLIEAMRGSGFIIENLVPGGSVAENVRLWGMTDTPIPAKTYPTLTPKYFVEFDYLAIMSGNDIEFKNESPCEGCICVYKGNQRLLKNYKDMFNYTISRIINDWDSQTQAQISWQEKQKGITNDSDVYKYWNEQLSKLSANGSHRVIERDTKETSGVIETASGSLVLISLQDQYDRAFDQYYNSFPLKFIWVSKTQHQGKQKSCGGFGDRIFGVHVDFLPAFELQKDPSDEREMQVFQILQTLNIENTRSSQIRFVVPRCSLNYCDGRSCWIVSTMLLEQEVIKGSSENHKDSYKLLKFFVLISVLSIPFTSYMLKTVFLYHLKECIASEGSVKGCFHAMLRSLSKICMVACTPHTMRKNNRLPHFFYGYNINKCRKIYDILEKSERHVTEIPEKGTEYFRKEGLSNEQTCIGWNKLQQYELLERFILLKKCSHDGTEKELSEILLGCRMMMEHTEHN